MMYDLFFTISVSGSISSLLIWLSKNWISEKIKHGIKHEYDAKLASINYELRLQSDHQLAQLKASIEKESEKIRFATSFIGESQKIVILRQLDAVDILWKGMLSIKESIPTAFNFIDALSEDEYKTTIQSEDFKLLIGDSSPEKMSKVFNDNSGSFERIRPYVGEYLWALFLSYQSIITRSTLLLYADKEKYWYADVGTIAIIKSSLSEREFIEFNTRFFGRFLWLRQKYESKVLTSIQQIMSGQEIGVDALRKAELMEQAIQAAS